MSQLNIHQNTYNIYKYAAFLSFAVILLLGVAFLQPFSFTDNTNATTERTTNGDYYIETTTTDLNLTINTTPAGAQETASHDVTVKTDDPAGYTLTVSVNNDTSNALNLNGSTSATKKFAATSGTYDTPKALDENSWGFADALAKKNNDQWAAVPLLSNAQQIKQTSAANTSGDTTTVHYAINAKYDGQHSNGNYSNTIVYSVTGNTVPKRTLDDITYMQDVVKYSDICENSTTWTTSDTKEYTLKDSRDNISYTIRKLADGHCWMAQNLRLTYDTLNNNSSRTASPKTTLTSDDTDINGSTASFAMPSNASWSAASASAGKLIKGVADATKLPVGSSSGSAATGDIATARGAYYSWCTATVDCTADPGTSKQQPSSICPKGWHLANSDGSSSTSTNQYQAVYNTYGSATSFNQAFNTYYNSGATNYLAGYLDARSGYKYVRYAGSYGDWWSSTSHSSDAGGAWRLRANTSSVTPASVNYRYYGVSVRCML